jgi:predicted transcriptional regulator
VSVGFDRRQLVLQSVLTFPGSHLRALERISGLPLGTVRHHVRTLLETRQVAMENDRRFRRFYPAAMPTDARRIWDALRSRQARSIVNALLESPASSPELARRLNLPQSTMRLYSRRLRILGVTEDRAGALALREPALVSATLLSIHPSRLDLLTDGAIGLFDALEAPRP